MVGIITADPKNQVAFEQTPIMARMKKLPLLGGMTPAMFLRDYWQKKPLLVRQAIPGFAPILSADALFSLAAQEEVEARLIRCHRRRWELQHGPFDRLPAPTEKNWTLLVQSANLHDDEADRLLQQFRFLPDSRLDDLMISYATDGGGVGPHVDSYDVFLLQAQGQRRWRISAQTDLSLVDGLPLKILRNFQAETEYVLEAGDMLYLPPHYAHEGVAIGTCQTYSIGFRAPAYQELGEAFLQFMADAIDLPGRYADPDLKPTTHPAMIDAGMLDRVEEALQNVRFTRDDVTLFMGEYLSEPKASVTFAPPARPLAPARFAQAAAKRGLRLPARTRMLYRGQHVFINGESFRMQAADRPLLTALANARRVEAGDLADVPSDVAEALHLWYADGWLLLG